ncbi:MAG: patatin-like phospholipase family protein [Candidatus Bipolaricaulota bacterium]
MLGLALGGGGARGFAHVGVIMALQQEGVRPDIVAGTSMGAMVGAMLAVDQDIPRLAQVLKRLDLHEIFGLSESYRRMLESTIGGAVWEQITRASWRQQCAPRLMRLYQFLNLLCKGASFDELSLPLACIAADVDTGEEVVIQSGPLYRGVAASAALPGVFQPAPWNGRHLIDGGVINKLPADVALSLGADTVLAVDVSAPLVARPEGTLDVILQSYTITAKELMREKLNLARTTLGQRLIVVRPQVEEIGILEFHRVEEAVDAGLAAGKEAARRLRALQERPHSTVNEGENRS